MNLEVLHSIIFFFEAQSQPVLLQNVIERFMNGILILTEQRELVYANESAYRILRQLNQSSLQEGSVPEEIWHICQTLIESRNLFPNQCWLIKSEILTDSSVTCHIWAQWLKLDTVKDPCLLLMVKDQYQSIKSIGIEEAQKYGLTARETDVWLLHRANYTYKQIATELGITLNTVKKHMKSIHIKQKEGLVREEY